MRERKDDEPDDLRLRYCKCADPENCREPVPGYVCRPRNVAKEWLAREPGYLNGYDAATEADQRHAYDVGFADARRGSR